MTRKRLWAVAYFLGVCLPLCAQQTDRIDSFRAMNNSISFPSLALSDRQLFSFTRPVAQPLSFNWIHPTLPDLLPPFATTERRRRTNDFSSAKISKDSSEEVDVRRNLFDYVSGEVGVFYGRSTGKYGREVEAGYIIGETGDDKFHISVGASYERVNAFGKRKN